VVNNSPDTRALPSGLAVAVRIAIFCYTLVQYTWYIILFLIHIDGVRGPAEVLPVYGNFL
jgi:hypothetical protein